MQRASAGVAELADAPDLGSGAAGCMSSSLFARTTLRLILICGNSSFGRAPPCQGGGGGFEPRFPLHFFNGCVSSFYAAKRHHSQAVRQRSAKPPFSSSNLDVASIKNDRDIPYACGSNSVVECNLAKVEVAGSNPVSRSIKNCPSGRE